MKSKVKVSFVKADSFEELQELFQLYPSLADVPMLQYSIIHK